MPPHLHHKITTKNHPLPATFSKTGFKKARKKAKNPEAVAWLRGPTFFLQTAA
jgi:hypothetical protein